MAMSRTFMLFSVIVNFTAMANAIEVACSQESDGHNARLGTILKAIVATNHRECLVHMVNPAVSGTTLAAISATANSLVIHSRKAIKVTVINESGLFDEDLEYTEIVRKQWEVDLSIPKHTKCILNLVFEISIDWLDVYTKLIIKDPILPVTTFSDQSIIFIFMDSIANLTPENSENLLYFKKLFSLRHLPPVFVLAPSPQHDIRHQNEDNSTISAWFICWYCHSYQIAKRIYQASRLPCSNPQNCAANVKDAVDKATNRGTNVRWFYLRDSFLVQDLVFRSVDKQFWPFICGQSRSSNCVDFEMEAVISIIFSKLNASMVRIYQDFPPIYDIPAVKKSSLLLKRLIFDPHAVEFTGYTTQFRFITAEGVRHDRNHLTQFLKPFNASVWLVITISIVLTCINFTLVGLWPSGVQNMLKAAIDQSGLAELAVRSSNFGVKALSVSWILSLLVLGNTYKGIFQMEYTLKPHYSTNWSNLLQLDNFTLYFGTRNISTSCQATTTLASTKIFCHLNRGDLACIHGNGRFPCRLFSELYYVVHIPLSELNSKDLKWLQSYTNKIQLLANAFKIVDLSVTSMEELVKLLKPPNTAFVTPEEYFDEDWNALDTAASRAGEVKFANNAQYRDDALRLLEGYILEGNVNNRGGVRQTLRVLSSSGLVQVWTKWQFWATSLRRRLATMQPAFKYFPLDLHRSDIYLVFELYCWCVLACVALFVLEQLWRCF